MIRMKLEVLEIKRNLLKTLIKALIKIMMILMVVNLVKLMKKKKILIM